MTADRWRRVEDLCHAALACSSEERASFLRTACAGDDALRRDVESLLAHCRKSLSSYKIPEATHIVAEIPRTGSGKIMRFKLVEALKGN